jgi:hypothetical protein
MRTAEGHVVRRWDLIPLSSDLPSPHSDNAEVVPPYKHEPRRIANLHMYCLILVGDAKRQVKRRALTREIDIHTALSSSVVPAADTDPPTAQPTSTKILLSGLKTCVEPLRRPVCYDTTVQCQ